MVSNTELLNPLDFLVIGDPFVLVRQYSWWATGWGLVTRKTKPGVEAWKFQPHLLFSGEGRAAGVKLNHSFVMKLPWKSQKYGILTASRLLNISICLEGRAPQLHRDRSSRAQDPFEPHPMYLFMGLSSYPLLYYWSHERGTLLVRLVLL